MSRIGKDIDVAMFTRRLNKFEVDRAQAALCGISSEISNRPKNEHSVLALLKPSADKMHTSSVFASSKKIAVVKGIFFRPDIIEMSQW